MPILWQLCAFVLPLWSVWHGAIAYNRNTTNPMLMRNPLIWLARFRHRRGYGVHSPFAFGFLTDVVYEKGTYYAYEELSMLYGRWHRVLDLLPLQRSRLLFRLVNFAHPRHMWLEGAGKVDEAYMRASCPSAVVNGESCDETVDFVYLSHPSCLPQGFVPHAGSMLVVDRLWENREWWKSVQQDERTGVTFDLYYLGVAFFDRKLYKQHYIVNW